MLLSVWNCKRTWIFVNPNRTSAPHFPSTKRLLVDVKFTWVYPCMAQHVFMHTHTHICIDDRLSVSQPDFNMKWQWEGWRYPGVQSEAQRAAKKKPSGQTPTMKERDIYREGKGKIEDEETFLCISSYTTSRVKGTNTFVLSTLKVQSPRVQEAVVQAQKQDKKVSFCAYIGFKEGSLMGYTLQKYFDHRILQVTGYIITTMLP